MFRGRGNIPHGPGRGNAVGGRGRGRGRGRGQRRRLRVQCEICWRCGGAKERLPGCGGEYCRSCGDRANAVIASDLRRRQRRRRELTELLPEVFRAYRAPPDVVGVVLRFVGYDLPGTARPPDRAPGRTSETSTSRSSPTLASGMLMGTRSPSFRPPGAQSAKVTVQA